MTAFINTYVENSCALRGARRVKYIARIDILDLYILILYIFSRG